MAKKKEIPIKGTGSTGIDKTIQMISASGLEISVRNSQVRSKRLEGYKTLQEIADEKKAASSSSKNNSSQSSGGEK